MKKKLSIGITIFIVLALGAVFIGQTLQKPSPPQEVIFIPGLNLRMADYSVLVEALQKEGFNVSEFRGTDTNTDAYPSLITNWTNELRLFVGERTVFVIGHSIGGAVATHYCSIDSHCITGINMDGNPAFDEKISVPFLYLQAGVGVYCDASCLDARNLMEKISSQSAVTVAKFPELRHYNFTDKRDQYLFEQGYLSSKDGRADIARQVITFLQTAKK